MAKKTDNKKKKRKVIAWVTAIIIAAGAGTTLFIKSRNNSEEIEPQLQTAEVERTDLVQSITISGTVQSAGKYSVTSSLIDTKIKTVNFKVGDRVKKGDVIAVLDDTQLKEKLSEAKKTLKKTKEKNKLDLESAQRSYDSLVSEGEIQAQRNNRDVNEAYADYVNAVNERNNIAQKYNEAINNRSALESQVNFAFADDPEIAAMELETARAAEEELSAQLKAADEMIKTSKDAYDKMQENKTDADKAQAKSLADQKDVLEITKITAEESLAAPKQEIEELKKSIDDCEVIAPADGIITSLNIKAGDIYKGDEMAVVQDDSGYVISANVDQYDISSLSTGLKADITTNATGDTKMKGELTFVSLTPSAGTAEITSTDYMIEAAVIDPDDRLRIGMSAKLIITLDEKADVLAVPDACVQQDDDGNYYIEVLDDNGETQNINVEYGMKTDYYAEVSGDGLKEGMQAIMPDLEEDDGTENAFFY